MPYPPAFLRHTSYRQRELAGVPINTANLDAEFNDIAAVFDQLRTRLMQITSASGRLRNVPEATAQALAGSQSFTAIAGQLIYDTVIVWDSSFTAGNVPVFLDGKQINPALVTVSDNAGLLRVTLNAGLTASVLLGSIVVIEAFSNGAGIAQRLADVTSVVNGANMVGVQDIDDLFYATTVEGCLRELRLLWNDFFAIFGVSAYEAFTATAAQLIYLTTITWDTSYTPNNVRVYKNGALLPVADVAVADNGGFLQVTLDPSVIVANNDRIEISILRVADILTRDGVSLDGKGMRDDLQMKDENGDRHRVVGMEDGVLDDDAVTLKQLKIFGDSLLDLLAIFIRADGATDFSANQSMANFRLTDLGVPVNPNDAARLIDVVGRLALIGTKASPAQGTLTGPVSLGAPLPTTPADADQTTNPATVVQPTLYSVPYPTHPGQVANQQYVLDQIAAATGISHMAPTRWGGDYRDANVVSAPAPAVLGHGLYLPLHEKGLPFSSLHITDGYLFASTSSLGGSPDIHLLLVRAQPSYDVGSNIVGVTLTFRCVRANGGPFVGPTIALGDDVTLAWTFPADNDVEKSLTYTVGGGANVVFKVKSRLAVTNTVVEASFALEGNPAGGGFPSSAVGIDLATRIMKFATGNGG